MPDVPRSRWVRRAAQVVLWALVALVVAALLPPQWGGRLGTTVVSGHSMEPTMWTGDLAVTWAGEDWDVGDVLVYAVPEGEPGEGGHVIHRVVEVLPDQSYRLLGDNNEQVDHWTPSDADVQGEVVAVVPGGGTYLRLLTSPLALALVCGLLVALSVLAGADEPDDPEQPDGSAGPDPEDRPRDRPALAEAGVGALAVLAAALTTSVAAAAGLGSIRADDLLATSRPVPPLEQPVTDATVRATVTAEGGTGKNAWYCAEVTVSTTSPAWIRWRATLNGSTTGLTAARYRLTTQPPDVRGASSIGFTSRGSTWEWVLRGSGANQQVRAGDDTSFSYCTR